MRYYKIRIILVAIVTMMGIGFTEVSAFQSESQPTVGIDSTGNLVAIWSVYDDQNGTYVIRSSSWNSITGWSPNTTISTTPGIISFSPLIEINSAGDAAVIWTALDNNFATLQGRIYYNGSWDSSPTLLSIGSESITGYYDLKLNNNGEIGVIWSSFSPNTGDYSIYVLTGSTVAAGWNTGTGITKISD